MDSGCTLESPRRGDSKGYPRCVYWIGVYHCIAWFYYVKVMFRGVYIAGTCFLDEVFDSQLKEMLKL